MAPSSMETLTKTCPDCDAEKSVDDFYNARNRADGRTSYCKPCMRQRNKMSATRRSPEVWENCKESMRRHDIKRQPIRHARKMVQKYGISEEEYQALLKKQGGVCAICQKPEKITDHRTGKPRALAVDHDHSCCSSTTKACGKCIRGLLCLKCNTVLGKMGDDPALLRRAADYLEGKV